MHSGDADFLVCQISFDTLLRIQLEAEDREFGTRWTSVDALRSQVKEAPVLLQSLMREHRGETVRAYRCLLLFATSDCEDSGGATTIDLTPERYRSLDRLDRDSDVRTAFERMFSLALGGISMVSKK